MSPSRIAAVATLRYREGVRGPLALFLLAVLVLAAAACLFVPGDAGPERQRAIDRLVFDAILFVTALAAATLGAAPDPADRAAGRDAVLDSGPLRSWERLVGAWLGTGTGLLLLLIGAFMGSMAVTELLSGGTGDRPPTREAIGATSLTGPAGAPADGRVRLSEPGQAAIFEVPDRAGGPDRPEVTVRIAPFADPNALDFPESYAVGVRAGGGPVREFQIPRGDPLRFRPRAGEGTSRIEVRRLGPVYTLALSVDGLVVEGAERPRSANLAKALASWLGGLMVLAAAAAALGTFVQAPVAVFGTLLIALVGRSLGLLEETAGFLAVGEAGGGFAAGVLRGIAATWPDLSAADLLDPVTQGWDIPAARLVGRIGATVAGSAAFLSAAWLVTAGRRRR